MWRATRADGECWPLYERMIGQAVAGVNGLDRLCRSDCRSDGALEEILRMPVSSAVVVVVGRLERRVRDNRVGLVMVVMVLVAPMRDGSGITVMVRTGRGRVMPVVMVIIVRMIVIRIVIVCIEVDVLILAAAVVVEVEPGAGRQYRRQEEPEAERGEFRQPCAQTPHAATISHPTSACHEGMVSRPQRWDSVPLPSFNTSMRTLLFPKCFASRLLAR